MEKPAEPVPNGMENGDGAEDEGNEWQVRIVKEIAIIVPIVIIVRCACCGLGDRNQK